MVENVVSINLISHPYFIIYEIIFLNKLLLILSIKYLIKIKLL